MSSTTSNVSPRQDTYWWQGSVMEVKARAEDTGGVLGVLEGRFFERGYGPPLHVHGREDEAMYVLEGQIRFRVGDDEFVAGPGTWVWQTRGVPHTFKVESEGARALLIFTPGGFERMLEEGGGVPRSVVGDVPASAGGDHPRDGSRHGHPQRCRCRGGHIRSCAASGDAVVAQAAQRRRRSPVLRRARDRRLRGARGAP